ncbi:MAG: hypothetical protein GVY14_04790 [Spirochaetes bacterium]|jgi:hypothetical protein|nr:hypothetical protein [Spirochaetota bacterium]
MGGMNGRVVLLAVLNTLVAVALAVLITVLVTSDGAPAPSAASATRGDGQIEALRGPQVRRTYPSEAQEDATGPQATDGPRALAERVKRDFMDREELIPFEGRLGGTMDFYDPESIYILSDRWVYAEFSDGHVQGGMLLEYTLEPDGEIRWRVLEARLE